MTDRERIYNLVDKVCDLSIKAIDKITELKQENSKLKQRVAELEKPKKKRKLRAMTNGKFHDFYCYNHINTCQTDDNSDCSIRFICRMKGLAGIKDRPYKTKDGKYIMIEVKE